MKKSASVALDQGVWRDGVPARVATLRPLTGADELALAELPAKAGIAARVTALLARAVERIGDAPAPDRDGVRALSVGDRERLLLTLHALSFGNAPDLVVTCSGPACGERLELGLTIEDIVQRPVAAPAALHEARLGDARVHFRLPTGADQEEIAEEVLSLGEGDPEAAAEALIDRCLVGAPALDRAALRALLAERMAALDPQAETMVDVACPSCGAVTPALVDAAPLLFARMADGRRLMAEIDRIARAYHWSEAEILALPVDRRHAYLELIAAAEAPP
jgi:hypothetical protein